MAKKKYAALIQTIVTVGVLAVLSFLVLKATDQSFAPDMAMEIDAGKIGQAILDIIVDAIGSLISPERRS